MKSEPRAELEHENGGRGAGSSRGRPPLRSWRPDPVCRLCGSPDTQPLGVVNSYSFRECRRCGFVFTPDMDPATAADRCCDLERLQAEGLPGIGWADASFLRPAFDLLPQGSLRILDFGTGQSVVPDLLRSQGHRVTAADVAPPLRPHPDRITGDIADLDLAAASFDLVFSFQVFEHLPEPRPILARLLELTRPRGILAIHTDMETEERSRGFEDWWYVLPPEHCSFYRHRTFRRAIEGTPHRLRYRDPKMICIEVGAG